MGSSIVSQFKAYENIDKAINKLKYALHQEELNVLSDGKNKKRIELAIDILKGERDDLLYK